MGADRTAMDITLKTVYEDGVSEGVHNKFPLRDIVKTEKVPFKGLEIQRLMHTSTNVSPMFVGEDGAFAEAGQQGYSKFSIDQKKLMSRLRMTWEVMQDSTSSEGAFISARKSEMQYLIDDMARRDEYAIASDGRGVLALVNEASPNANTTLITDSPGGITNSNFGNRFITAGMFLAFVSPNSGTFRSVTDNAKVTATDSAGANVTVDAAANISATAADNDYIVQAADKDVTSINDTSFEKAWWGLMALVDDGTYRENYFGVVRDDVPATASYVTASTGTLSTDLIQRVSDVVDQKLGGRIDMILCHHVVRRLVIQLTDSDRRYSGASLLKPEPGTAAFKQGDIPFGGVTVRAIRTFPLDVMMFLDTANMGFKEYVSESGKWVDEDGSVLVRVGTGSTGRDAFEAWYRMRKQYFVEYPAYCARLDGITISGLVVQRPAGN